MTEQGKCFVPDVHDVKMRTELFSAGWVANRAEYSTKRPGEGRMGVWFPP